MKCPECGGVGRIHYGEEWCSACNGTGEVQTNEEWFCGLSTEEKAKWITKNLSVYADDWVKSDEKLLNPATWVDWLNKVHE